MALAKKIVKTKDAKTNKAVHTHMADGKKSAKAKILKINKDFDAHMADAKAIEANYFTEKKINDAIKKFLEKI
jgi:hypothetical protein